MKQLENYDRVTTAGGKELEFSGETRTPEDGEWFLNTMGKPVQASDEVFLTGKYQILQTP